MPKRRLHFLLPIPTLPMGEGYTKEDFFKNVLPLKAEILLVSDIYQNKPPQRRVRDSAGKVRAGVRFCSKDQGYRFGEKSKEFFFQGVEYKEAN